MYFQSLVLASTFVSSAFAAFGVTTTSSAYVVDTGASNSLVVSISRSSCDINSIKFRGTELQYSGKGSHISSGLGSATVTAEVIKTDYIKVTCKTSTLTHYLMFKSGMSNVYMATHITAEPEIGELRFIARLNPKTLPEEYPFGSVSTTSGGSAIEGSDVFNVGGQTRSKFYSSERHIDDSVHCVYGGSDVIHACMVIPQYESSTGGPFHRDINTNNAGDFTALYFYMNSGHLRLENDRMGLHGPYAMTFSRSGIPKAKDIDMSWIANMGLSGYVADSGRGRVTGSVSGVDSKFNAVVHWYNSAAQYWTYASSNKFTSPLMKPGTYTMKLYQEEFPVATSTVSVAAAATKTANIAASTPTHNTIWIIGDIDGKPDGFLNADKQLRMHPSDSRMGNWGPITFTVGSSKASAFPMALFKSVNNPVTIKFSLDSVPSGTVTLRIATTLSFASGRPQAKINSYTAAAPAAPRNLDSRGVTRGGYRGDGDVYDVKIPSGTLKAGSNTIEISVVSGSSGEKFLSPNFIFDFVELFN